MVILIAGSSHTGKTLLAQKLLEKYKYPYLSIDHLKMGLIRSKNTSLTPNDDEELTEYLWNIVKEIIKTNIENEQNIIIEGCYIPFNWKESFDEKYLKEIKFICLIMTEKYIKDNYKNIEEYGSIIEKRKCEELDIDSLIEENKDNLKMCLKNNYEYILIEDKYNVDFELGGKKMKDRDINIKIADYILNCRAVAIIENEGKNIISKRENDKFWALPGGKVEVGEPTKETVKRELSEELGIKNFEIDNVNTVAEHFFEFNGEKFHQYIFGHKVKVDLSEWIFANKYEFKGIEENKKIIFKWIDIDKLDLTPLKPDFLKEQLKNINKKVVQFISYKEEK